MERGKPLRRDTERSKAWGRRRRRPLPQRSVKRKIDETIRAKVRANVLDRDRGCRALGLAIERQPGGTYALHETCEVYPWADRPGLEVHELWPGAGRVTAWLDEDRCVAVCPKAHDHITANPEQATLVGLIVRG